MAVNSYYAEAELIGAPDGSMDRRWRRGMLAAAAYTSGGRRWLAVSEHLQSVMDG
jgi:hypothetical protein